MARFLHRHPEYVMAAFVLLLVLGISLVRSAGGAITVGGEAPVPATATLPSERPWFDVGMGVWDARCYACHADLTYIPALYLAEGGRTYLLELLLFGVRGEVITEGAPQNLRHRSYATLDDAEIAAVLNVLLVAWGNEDAMPTEPAFYAPEEVAAARTPVRSNEEVLERRPNPWP